MIEALLAPIRGKQAAGACETDYEPLETLEDLMLKYGSLHQNTIDWEKVEALCLQILQDKCKHYRVALHLVTCWLNKRGVAGLIDSLHLLAGFLAQYWTNGHPRPGNVNIRYRKKLAEQMLFRMDQAAQRLLNDAPPNSQLEKLQAAYAELEQQSKKRKLEPGLKKLAGRLAELKPGDEEPAQDAQANAASQPTKSASSSQAAPKLADLGDERQIKRLLFDLADMINQQDADDPLGYQIRRYALWSGLQSTPPLNPQGESELSPPPADITNEYAEQVSAGSNDPDLLRRIEKSVVASPLWLTGSVYAAQAAQSLGFRSVAQAILQTTQALLQRLPALDNAKFRGGVPYIDQAQLAQAAQAIHTQAATPDTATSASRLPVLEWTALQENWDQLRKDQGIAAVLEQVEQQQQNANTPRHAFYLKLLAAQQIQAAGLNQVARDLLTTTHERVAAMSVDEWEPDYLHSIQSILEGK